MKDADGAVAIEPVARAVSKEDSFAITGMHGLSEILGLHNATDRQGTTASLDLVFVVTPHFVSLTHRETGGTMRLLPLH